jgi:hypothetical protein
MLSARQPAGPEFLELSLRRRLGIPDDARRVLVLAESSHWDPNWVRTSEEYYQRLVEGNLDQALVELRREPGRIYSVECVFFLRLYWERRPEQRDAVRSLINEGRLRLTNSGVTTADTLLPKPEAILRDLLIGQEWLRANGMEQEPRLAYFTDSFGCSPALPSLLRAAGFNQTAITRIDGMYFPGCDFEPRSRFPRPGSSADLLLNEERTLDFVWRGPDGAEVLCHWNAFTYGQGDLLAHRGFMRTYLVPFAIADRSDGHVARRLNRFADQLEPYSRTPYLFCPIGFDFVSPLPGLVALLDRYNRRHYPTTGIWAVNAGLDDYLTLVDCHRDELPVLELDPNPYWTGFYTSRPTLKERCHRLVDLLLLAERLALQSGDAGRDTLASAEFREAWWTAVTANHHDFITGTSPDRIVTDEQLPWLEQATATAQACVRRLAPPGEGRTRRAPVSKGKEPPEWRQGDGRLEVRTPHYLVELAEEAGGGIIRALDAMGREILGAVSNDLVCYRDTGGLWRMGHEFLGGSLRELARASDRPARLEVQEREGALEVSCETSFAGLAHRRRLWFDAGSPAITMEVEGRAARRCTVTVCFETAVAASHLVMDQPGGVVVRPPSKIYDPTFWPAQHFVHVQDGAGEQGLALCLRQPGAVAYRPDGRLEGIALRNATREMAFGFVPIPATLAMGHERERYAFSYSLLLTAGGNWRENGVAHLASALTEGPWRPLGDGLGPDGVNSLATVDRHDVVVIAAKPASRGEGMILRLQTFTTPGPPLALSLPRCDVEAAILCDARERDLQPLEVRQGTIRLTMPGCLATVRVLPGVVRRTGRAPKHRQP